MNPRFLRAFIYSFSALRCDALAAMISGITWPSLGSRDRSIQYELRVRRYWNETKYCDTDQSAFTGFTPRCHADEEYSSFSVPERILRHSLYAWHHRDAADVVRYVQQYYRLFVPQCSFWLAKFLALFCNSTKLNGDEKNEWDGDLDIENPNLHDYKYKMWII